MNLDLVTKAARFAAQAHAGQTRKESNMPYIAHPASAALMVAATGGSDVEIAAALVHDVPEENKTITIDDIRTELGVEVAAIVEALNADEDKSLPWEERKRTYIEQVRAGAPSVRVVALAEKLDNLRSMVAGAKERGPDFWGHFTRGYQDQLWLAEALLALFKETLNHPLVAEYEKLVAELKQLN